MLAKALGKKNTSHGSKQVLVLINADVKYIGLANRVYNWNIIRICSLISFAICSFDFPNKSMIIIRG